MIRSCFSFDSGKLPLTLTEIGCAFKCMGATYSCFCLVPCANAASHPFIWWKDKITGELVPNKDKWHPDVVWKCIKFSIAFKLVQSVWNFCYLTSIYFISWTFWITEWKAGIRDMLLFCGALLKTFFFFKGTVKLDSLVTEWSVMLVQILISHS